MVKRIWGHLMSFKNIFNDDNTINEKSVIGFISFAVMVLFAVADLVTAYCGKDLLVQEFIYNSFVIVTLGSFGVSGLEKFANKRNN